MSKSLLFLIFLWFAGPLELACQLGDPCTELQSRYDSLRTAEEYEATLNAALDLSACILQAEGDTSLRYAVSLRWVGNSYYYVDQLDEAIASYQQSLEVLSLQGRESHPDFENCLNNLGIIYSDQGDYSKAEGYYLRALEILRAVYGESHPDVATSLYNLAINYNDQGNYSKAEEYYLQLLEIERAINGESHPDVARSLNNLASNYNDQGDYAKAEEYHLQSLEISRAVFGESHPDVARSLSDLGLIYMGQGDYAKAQEYFLQVLEISREVYGESHPDVARSLNIMGVLYNYLGDYEKAEECHLRALEIGMAVLGESHPDVATSLNNLAINYNDQGDYAKAEHLYLRALEIWKVVLGESHPHFASGLNNMAIYYSDQGDYLKAEAYYLRSLEIGRAVHGELHPNVASSLINLAIHYDEQGDYTKAEAYYLRSLEIGRTVHGESHPAFASILNNLANHYRAQGDYSKAEKYHLKSLEIRKAVLGESHLDCASSLENLGVIYSDLANYSKAEEYHLRSLEIRRSVLGESHPLFASSLENLAANFSDQGDYAKAEEYHLQSLEIRRTVFGESHPALALSLYNLGVNYSYQRDYAKAEQHFLHALEILRSVFGESHPDFASNLYNLGVNYSDQGDYAKAIDFRQEHLALEKQLIAKSFVGMSAHQRSLFWEMKNDAFASAAELAVAMREEKGAGALAYNGLLFGKGLLLSSTRELDEAVLATGDSLLMVAFEEMKASRRMVTKMQAEGGGDQALLDFHEARAERNEKLISTEVGAYQAMQERLNLDWKDVRHGLQKGEAAIEFGAYWSDADSTMHYVGFVILRGTKQPIVVPLFTERDLDLKWAELSAFDTNVLYRQINKDLGRAYELIWAPLEEHLEGIQTVYYSGAGLLNQFPLHAMYQEVEGRRQYVLDRFDIQPLSTTGLIAEGLHQRNTPLQNDLLALGGLNYDVLPKTEPLQVEDQDALAIATGSQRPFTDPNLRGGESLEKWSYLRGTLKEVEAMQDLLTEAKWDVENLTWSDGDEVSLKQRLAADPPAVLHLATHGYAFPNPYEEREFSESEGQRSHYRIGEDPLVRTGLILSGGNHAWMGSDTLSLLTGEDGVLTAAELANMNLDKTELVVLSACETGLGETNGMEGTMGLCRGIKLAGVEEVVQSFWRVPDAETKELMILFYGHLADSHDPATAFRTAQHEMRDKYPNDPAHWASFSLIR